ncbi:MAG: hypothetical protein ACXWUG_27695 [Polyangiales bacterium]
MTKRFLPLLALALLAGCSSKKDDAPVVTCDDRAKVDGVCPGVSSAAVGTDGVACSSQISVASAGELSDKASSATAGSCLVLEPGTYGAVTLPAGVSLLGKGSSGTTVDGVTLTGGTTATIRGIAVGAGGIIATGKGDLTVDRVLVSHATNHGINVTDTNLTVLTSTIEYSGKFGLALGSSCTMACTERPKLVIKGVFVREAHGVGIWAHGADVILAGVQVDTTRAQQFLYGRGLEVAAEPENGQTCSITASSFAVLHGDEVGVFVDGCSADFSGFLSSQNIRGMQLQNIPDGGAKVQDFTMEANKALGLGISKSKGIIVQGGRIASTVALRVPVDVGGVQEVGDGLNWLESDVNVGATVTIENSARQGVIIDSTSTGKFDGVLGGGDEAKGIIVQGGLTAGGVQDGLNISGSVKTEVLTKDKAVPVADRVAKKKKD